MKNPLKVLVNEKYSRIARENNRDCCGDIPFDKEYSSLQGYAQEADLGLGCGLPTEFARIWRGSTVVDLGCGAGNDCFIARAETGDTGRVIGVDFSEDMLTRARSNVRKLGFENVDFVSGDIEQVPLPGNSVDIVVSNCVFNLVPDKRKAFAETFRILRPGGHFSISDIVTRGSLPEGLRADAEAFVGCVAGAVDREHYLDIIQSAGFKKIAIQKEKRIPLPAEMLAKHGIVEEKKGFGIFSITVFGEKAVLDA